MKNVIVTLSLVLLAAGCGAGFANQKSELIIERDRHGRPTRIASEANGNHAGVNASVAGALFGAESGGGIGLAGMGYGYGGVATHRGIVAVVDQVSLDGGHGGYASPAPAQTARPRTTRSAAAPIAAPAAPASQAGGAVHMDPPGAHPATDARIANIEQSITVLAKNQRKIAEADCTEYLKQNLTDKKSEACKKVLGKKGN
jgi:hypothetical protein